MTTITTNFRIKGSARDAGANVVHTVSLDGEVVATRRSAHRYAFAIAYWTSNGALIVSRWSRSAKCSGRHFAIRVQDAA
jgi:hypothetical protein